MSGHEQLEGSDSPGQYIQPEEDSKGQAPLEPNHTEFIFIDDGTEGKYGGEIEFRGQLEAAISSGFFEPKTADDSPEKKFSSTGSDVSKSDQSGCSFLPVRNSLRYFCCSSSSSGSDCCGRWSEHCSNRYEYIVDTVWKSTRAW